MDYLRTVTDIARLLQKVGDEIILPAWQGAVQVQTKSDGSSVTEIDLACQNLIATHLQALDASIGFLGEEMEPDTQQACLHSAQPFWCVDPLDGTSNFIAGIPAFASSVALIREGEPVLACVYDPVRGETFSAIRGQGARLNGAPLKNSHTSPLAEAVGYIDFKRLPGPLAARFATEKIYRSQRNIGTCALEWAWLAAGRGQFILHGGQKLWDYSAGALLATEAGCIVSDFDHAPLFPCERLFSPIAAAAMPSLHRELIARLHENDNPPPNPSI